MIHDPELTDKLSAFKQIEFNGVVYRATGLSADPVASSLNGGRWAPPSGNRGNIPVLYTSLSNEGALAEVASYLALLTPIPRKPLKISKLDISVDKSLTLAEVDLADLGIDLSIYKSRNYIKTQEIGAAANFLGIDGLIAPSARWDCQNLMIFPDNHSMNNTLDVLDSEEIDWFNWAKKLGLSKRKDKTPFLVVNPMKITLD